MEFDPRLLAADYVHMILEAYEEAIAALADGRSAPLPDFASETRLHCPHASRRAALRQAANAQAAARAHLGRIWEDVLGRPVGAHDSLQDSGGDSIQALVVSERIAVAFGCEPPLRELLNGATVERLSHWLARPHGAPPNGATARRSG
ncbi:acyl carrier protein [Mycobacterium ulcerans]|uniref:Acyl carrier protein n=2 Tax=Mycobacterium ulcerans TaxID=1809 RepID=A0ABY3V5W3_MYCUL|nr:acyl carrier protein [Mycobacterium ulcerans]EUA85813.1 phosphopantetheine attachment site family protein [Mycobacterium ulcerans str. Harvey]MEB3907074.1 acyl carrier protein [Mycobacterium ulcerans]MEB3911210.1 acyl carrier protein [Mycobacterium ulcerans]MEB3921447.1 acyl carrier protein [Mycobacterium ulcerans]MEB3925575.1 acyl carrier protein [Mycobacterium ulcerans]